MDKKPGQSLNIYERPEVLNHQPVRFETAHCWNKGVGNKDPGSNGNGGINYPNDPRPEKKPWLH